ncbi:MAG TPA: hypothetical protein VG166_06670 [Caulobacteraceae bacterium]|jgi:hypothetical protein|nr:hypothetical protein [Caulobacteraceae bacterium]
MAEPDPIATSADAAGKVHDLGRHVESGVERVRRLQQETRLLAQEQVEILARDMKALADRSTEVAEGGDAYPVGVRELCSRMADELNQQAQSLIAIIERSPRY